MNPENLALNFAFLSTLSSIDNPELLRSLTIDVQVGKDREVLRQETLNEDLKYIFYSLNLNFIKDKLLGGCFFSASYFNRAERTVPL